MTDHNPFSVALARYMDGGELRMAFDACNREPDLERYDRTSLGRWLQGSIPSRGDFVATLAAKLGDLSLYEAWVEARNGPTPADVKAVVTRFRGLPRDQKDDAFRQLRDHYLTSSLTVRSRFSMRVELHDSDAPDLYRFKVRMAVNWTGYLPAQAKVVFTSEDTELSSAFGLADCIFREVVRLEEQRFNQVFNADDPWEQVLSFRPTMSKSSRATQLTGSMTLPGVFEFANEESNRAGIMLRIEYPIPPGVPIFPILFKSYQISGPAVITLALHSDDVHSPRAFAFLGHGRNWVVNELDREIVLEAGASGVLLGADTGVIFYWLED